MNATQAETADRSSSVTGQVETAEADTEGHLDAATEDSIEKDELFHLLKSERRRRALRYLLEANEEPVRMRTLAEAVAATEYDTTVQALSSDERQRVYITLYQSHLPQLDRAGVIDYNQSRGRITTNPLIEEFDDYLEGPGDDAEPSRATLKPAAVGFGIGGVATIAAVQAVGALGAAGALAAAVVAVAAAIVTWHGASDRAIKDRRHKPVSTN